MLNYMIPVNWGTPGNNQTICKILVHTDQINTGTRQNAPHHHKVQLGYREKMVRQQLNVNFPALLTQESHLQAQPGQSHAPLSRHLPHQHQTGLVC